MSKTFWQSFLDGLGLGPLWRWIAERRSAAREPKA